jgi:hypothetical protein
MFDLRNIDPVVRIMFVLNQLFHKRKFVIYSGHIHAAQNDVIP